MTATAMMVLYGGLPAHPVAELFPLIEGEQFDLLVEDVKGNGLREAIMLTADGRKIIDGRNRARACETGGVAPVYARWEGSEAEVTAYILTKNLRRRSLTVGQLAMLGHDLLPFYKSNKKQPDVRAIIGKIVGVAHSSIEMARRITQTDTEVMKLVRSGSITLAEGYERCRRRPKLRKYRKPLTGATIELKTHLGAIVHYPKTAEKATFNRTNEAVSWARWTWNPVTGCLHGCPYCYAREISMRSPAYPVGFTPLFHHERLEAPKYTPVPDEVKRDARWGRVFVCSMADLYGKWVPEEWITAVHASAIANPQWEYLFLTKFPRRYVDLALPRTAWLGTSVDEQKRVRLAEEAFKSIGGVRVKWLSLEPLLAPLEFSDLSMFDWVVIGSQTATEQPDGPVGAVAPPFDWVARIVAQAREAGCRVYLKPNLLGRVSSQSPGMILPMEEPLFDRQLVAAE
jgi:protein gp37